MPIDAFKIEAFIAWAETQDPEHLYDFTSAVSCIMTRYFESAGIERTSSFIYGPITVEIGVWNYIAQGRPRTYGAALARAKERMEVVHAS